MIMKSILTIALTTFAFLSFAQTDIIEMRSRNASLKKYERTVKSDRSDHVASNFGMAPTRIVTNAVLDSVKCISDTVAIMYTSNYCTRGYHPRLEPVQFDPNQQPSETQKPERVYGNPRIGNLWQPGADTVVNHPLFTRNNSLDSVKQVIDASYNFNLPSDSIEFIGFEKAEVFSNEKSNDKVKRKRQKKNSVYGLELLLMLTIPLLVIFFLGRYIIPKSSN